MKLQETKYNQYLCYFIENVDYHYFFLHCSFLEANLDGLCRVYEKAVLLQLSLMHEFTNKMESLTGN